MQLQCMLKAPSILVAHTANYNKVYMYIAWGKIIEAS